MPTETVTPAASSTKTETKPSELAAAAAAGAARKVETAPPAPPAAGAGDPAAAKAAADKAASDAAAAAKDKPPGWHPPEDEAGKAAAAKAAEDKKVADAAAAAKTAAEPKIELKAPEGAKVDQGVLDKHLALAKELGLSQAQAQGLLEKSLVERKAADDAIRTEMQLTDQRWGKELVEGWGPKAVENDVLAKRGWDAIDPTGAVRKGLKEIGLLNWPVATNALVEFARRNLGEDSIGAQTVGKSAKKPLSPEEAFEQGYRDRQKKGGN